MIDYLGTGSVVVKCDDCDKKAIMSAIPSEHLIDGKYCWHPRWFYKRPPRPSEIDHFARTNGIQYFKSGRARRNHMIDGGPRHLCDICRKRRRRAYLTWYSNRTWFDKLKGKVKEFFK